MPMTKTIKTDKKNNPKSITTSYYVNVFSGCEL